MIKAIRIAILMACTVHGPAAWAQDALDLPVDERIKMLIYDEADVYTITTRYGYQTNIVFSPSEEIQTISVGDRSLWQIIPAGNRLFIRPMAEGVTTNMTVLSTRRSYQFDLKSLSPDDTAGNIYVARFVYPDEQPMQRPRPPVVMEPPPAEIMGPSFPPPVVMGPPAPPPASTAAPIAEPVRPVNPNYNYSYVGTDELAPIQVYDDGVSTYFRWPNPSQPMPNPYTVRSDGTESLATPYLKGGMMVVDAVASEWALKSSNGIVRIYNEMLNPK